MSRSTPAWNVWSPDRSERAAITAEVVERNNPRGHPAEIGPRRPMPRASTASRQQIAEGAEGAEAEFKRGIQLALGTGTLLVAIALAPCWAGFPPDRRPPATATIRGSPRPRED